MKFEGARPPRPAARSSRRAPTCASSTRRASAASCTRHLEDRGRLHRHHDAAPRPPAPRCRSRSPSRCAQEAADGRRHPRRVGPREPDAHRDRAQGSNRVDTDQLMAHLFATTDLERNYRVNLNVIALDGRPRVMGLRELLTEWLQFRTTTVTRAPAVAARQGRQAPAHPRRPADRIPESRRGDPHHPPRGRAKPVLMKRFKLSNEQAEAIPETKLRHLAKLEEMKIREEQKEARRGARRLEAILKSKGASLQEAADCLRSRPMPRSTWRPAPPRSWSARPRRRSTRPADVSTTRLVTVVLDRRLVRCAKGHEIDPRCCSKNGDGYQHCVAAWRCSSRCSSTRPVAVVCAAGAFTARVQLLSGRSIHLDGAVRPGVMGDRLFCGWFRRRRLHRKAHDLITDRRAGKTAPSVPEGGLSAAGADGQPRLAGLRRPTPRGRLLVFPARVPMPGGQQAVQHPGRSAAARRCRRRRSRQQRRQPQSSTQRASGLSGPS